MKFSIEAEQSLIGALMLDPERLGEVLEVITAMDFYNAKHRGIFTAIQALAATNTGVDMITVCDHLSKHGQLDDCGGFVYVSDLAANCSSTANVISYAGLIAERALERKMFEAGQNICAIADSQEIDVVAKVAAMQAEVSAIEPNTDTQMLPWNALIQQRIMALDSRFRGKVKTGLQTGFSALDERFAGIEKGSLWILAARPSMGKTTLALNIANNVVQAGGEVLIFSLEMTREEITDKIICSAARLNFGVYRSGNLNEAQWPQIESGVRLVKDKGIHVIDEPAIDIRKAANIAKKFARKGNLQLILVDYLQLMKAKTKDRFQEVSEVSRSLKAMAKNCGCVVLALSQLNRNCEDRNNKRPGNNDLRESGQIEQDADIITFIYRDDFYNADSTHKGIAELITTKWRSGSVGTDFVESRLGQSLFQDLTYAVPNAAQSQPRKNDKGFN